ncbi:ATP-binding cassette domain-containing protein [Phycicoccus endophyticus]|uniref:ATP-binding cassette domain-containing protein n=1 Tax=Phycicoccus endophyticus TaxID=1690220 RepID=A0A7G9R1S9_9MICO|nr:ATP-binding cassette domain-containing protein [Phycicoccus endophyticus]NHI18648.1 ATP-binding cassette domain-containing protein [Phycicoccus endophyticus]QNN49554.1 ATP-binding cassette domain-containing protein [Phycicoccus endophyticus]
MSVETLVVADGVRRDYPSGSTVGPVSLQMSRGRCLGLVGSNGAGKTTLMKMVVGLERPDVGTVVVCGRDVQAERPVPGLSGMIEEPRFHPRLSGRENLFVMCGGDRARRERIPELLDQVDLAGAAERPVGGYSQGMRQRLGIARVLLAAPDVVVLDEPTNGLDPEGIRWFRRLVASLKADGRAVLLSSHMLHEVQASSDDYVMLNRGVVVAEGETGSITGVGSLEELYFATVETGAAAP